MTPGQLMLYNLKRRLLEQVMAEKEKVNQKFKDIQDKEE